MKTSKKILGVLLALAMLVNVFAVFSFAAAPDSAIDLTITPDKESYSAGEVVTFTVSEKVIAANNKSLQAVEETNDKISEILDILVERQENIEQLIKQISSVSGAIVELQKLESTLNKITNSK